MSIFLTCIEFVVSALKESGFENIETDFCPLDFLNPSQSTFRQSIKKNSNGYTFISAKTPNRL